MDTVLYYVARGLLACLQALPLLWVARIGRALGAVAYCLDARHRNVAIRNLTMCFGQEKSPDEIRAIARENLRRIGENFACAAKTASMSLDELRGHLEVIGVENIALKNEPNAPPGHLFAIGHFGNFELFARASQMYPLHQGATTYRAIKSPGLNRLLLSLREKSGVMFFERRTQGGELRAALAKGNLTLALLTDQHAGDNGIRLPFFGHDCSTIKAPAVFALRYELPLHVAICYRMRPGFWRIEIGKTIPLHRDDGQPRAPKEIMLDVNRAFETAVRRDPANWFWVHKRWKSAGRTVTPHKHESTETPAIGHGE